MKIKQIKKVVSKYYDIDLDVKSRKTTYTIPRGVMIYLCRELTDKSYPQINRYLNIKDHSTLVIAAKKTTQIIESKLWDDKHVQQDIKNIRLILGGL